MGYGASRPAGAGAGGGPSGPLTSGRSSSGVRVSTPMDAAKAAGAAAGGETDRDFVAGDKVSHGKWGIGTVVSVRGSSNDKELQIAFPAPIGLKKLLASFAPITKV